MCVSAVYSVMRDLMFHLQFVHVRMEGNVFMLIYQLLLVLAYLDSQESSVNKVMHNLSNPDLLNFFL